MSSATKPVITSDADTKLGTGQRGGPRRSEAAIGSTVILINCRLGSNARHNGDFFPLAAYTHRCFFFVFFFFWQPQADVALPRHAHEAITASWAMVSVW